MQIFLLTIGRFVLSYTLWRFEMRTKMLWGGHGVSRVRLTTASRFPNLDRRCKRCQRATTRIEKQKIAASLGSLLFTSLHPYLSFQSHPTITFVLTCLRAVSKPIACKRRLIIACPDLEVFSGFLFRWLDCIISFGFTHLTPIFNASHGVRGAFPAAIWGRVGKER